ncbi:MAG: carboxypeptidase regulatory-like domain-containing protein [Bacteroidota bacterium]|nr:carboxypeptidase regulatory-like domain-containing protein [Bacteroidota bacterium]
MVYFIVFSVVYTLPGFAQETNSQISGKIITDKNETLSGATVTAIHEPTKNIFITQSRADGYFHLFNIKPGGPYTIMVTYTGYESIKKNNVFLNLNSSDNFFNLSNNDAVDFILKEKNVTMKEVIVSSFATNKTGIETDINNQKLLTLPSISRNLQDYIRLVPQAKVNGDGMMSLAGQSSRFNAFFIDGANNNDVLGLSESGTNGGQTASPPISMDAIEQIKVLLAPYDVQYSNFTGGSINAITRSGTNEIKASAWYYFRNEQLAGRSPVPVENPVSQGIFEYPKLSHFVNQTAGVRIGGPIIKNKLFYFILAEKQSEVRPQPFNISEYRGTASLQQLNALADLLRNKYQYEPGSLENTDELNAHRFVAKIDWNPSAKNKFTLSYRYSRADRKIINSNSGNLLFSNGNPFLPTTTHSSSFEWKRFFNHDVSNRLLTTFTTEFEDRKWSGEPFPRIIIPDGIASIALGSAPGSGLSLFKATEVTLSDIVKFIKNKHTIITGIDVNFSKLIDANISNYFGVYQFRNLNDFMNGAAPIRFQKSFSLLDIPEGDNTLAAAKFKTFHAGSFINDDIHFNTRLNINIGLRLDNNSLPTRIYEDKFFNDTALSIISKYYNLEGARAGQTIKPHWQLSPRIGFTYKIPEHKINISGGGGIFTGHILNVWGSVLHQRNGVSIGSIDINPQQYGLKFNPDPYNQPTPQSLGFNTANAKGELDLVSKNFRYPTIFRSSLTVQKKLKGNWSFSVEGIFTKNIYETKYTNVNILPPTKYSSPPDARNIYSLNTTPIQIPLTANGGNPYTGQIFLLSNNHEQKGSSYSISFITDKTFGHNFSINASYTYGKSFVLFEPSPGNTLYNLQWRQTETINGRNFTERSISDVDLRHRIVGSLVKKFSYAKNNLATTVTLFYNGQSGSPYSYVYFGSLVNDNNIRDNFDLIYIPTVSDLSGMTFLPNSVGTTLYSPQQQKDLLNDFIEQDKYLQKHRGEFAERNGERLPFTHIIDLRIQQDFKIKIKKKETGFNITFDVFNFTNMLNKNWGRTYFMANDNFPLIRFSGYANTATLTPQYQFTPLNGTPYSIQSSTLPGNSARWISQLGFRINFN